MPTALPQIGHLVTHWDAGDLALNNNDPVASWVDGVGGATAAQADAGLQPTYKTNRINGLPGVTFDGTEWMLAGRPAALVAALDSQDYSIQFIFRTLGTVERGPIFAAAVAGTNEPWWQTNGVTVGRHEQSFFPYPGQTSWSTMGTTSFTIDPTHGAASGYEHISVNGTVVKAYGFQTPATNGQDVSLGASNTGFYKGHVEIFEILVWDAPLSPAETIQFHQWACEKYGQTPPLSTVPSLKVFDGDSIMAFNSDLIGAEFGLDVGQWVNLAVAGATAAQLNSRAPSQIDGLAAATGKYVDLCFFEWYNQRNTHPGPANNTIAYAAARRAVAKQRLVLGTSTDTSATTDANRAAYNAHFDANYASHCDAYVPIHDDPLIGVETAHADDPTLVYFTPDGIHLKGPGSTILGGLFADGADELPVEYEVTGGAASVVTGETTAAFTLAMSAVAEADDTITLTASSGTITVTAAGATITGNGTGTVEVEMPAGMFEFTFTYTGGTVGEQTIALTNGQGWANPADAEIEVTEVPASGGPVLPEVRRLNVMVSADFCNALSVYDSRRVSKRRP